MSKQIFGSKNFFGQKIFGSKKFLDQKKFGVKIICGSKKLCVEKIFGQKSFGWNKFAVKNLFFVSKNLGGWKKFGPKEVWVETFWGLKKDLDQKKFLNSLLKVGNIL